MAGITQKQLSLCDAKNPIFLILNLGFCHCFLIPLTITYLSLSLYKWMGYTYLDNFFKVFKFMLNRDL